MPDRLSGQDQAAGQVLKAGGSVLRADAARNVVQIREAALAAFRGRGLGTPLAQIAAAAGVSKATLYNHFGGREGLIDAVIDELVAAELHAAMDTTRGVSDPWKRLSDWIAARRDLQYREPAFTDVMLGAPSGSRGLAELAREVTKMTTDAVRSAHGAGVLRPDLTAADLFWADVANGLALRQLRKPSRPDYNRRTRQFIDSLQRR